MENNEFLQEEEVELLTLTDENGVDVEFELLDSIDYEGKEYIVLLPADENDNEVMILEVEPVDDETENFYTVKDEEIVKTIYGIFKEHYKDVFTFED